MNGRIIKAAAGLVVLALTGCSSPSTPPPVMTITGNDANQINAEQQAGGEFDRIKDPPIKAETRYAAGQLAESQNAFPQAVQQYQEALKANPEHLGALYRLGVVYAQLKQYPQAIATWQQYVRATHESAAGYSNLGFCYELAGEVDKAEEAYRKGIERDSDSAPCHSNYGLMLARLGRTGEAALQFQAAHLTPAEIHYNLGSVYEMQGRKQQAKAEYQKAIELDAKMRDAVVRLDGLE